MNNAIRKQHFKVDSDVLRSSSPVSANERLQLSSFVNTKRIFDVNQSLKIAAANSSSDQIKEANEYEDFAFRAMVQNAMTGTRLKE